MQRYSLPYYLPGKVLTYLPMYLSHGQILQTDGPMDFDVVGNT